MDSISARPLQLHPACSVHRCGSTILISGLARTLEIEDDDRRIERLLCSSTTNPFSLNLLDANVAPIVNELSKRGVLIDAREPLSDLILEQFDGFARALSMPARETVLGAGQLKQHAILVGSQSFSLAVHALLNDLGIESNILELAEVNRCLDDASCTQLQPLLVIAPCRLSDVSIVHSVNELCVRHHISLLPAILDGHSCRIGPLVIPHQTPCFNCAWVRLLSNMAHPGEFLARAIAPVHPKIHLTDRFYISFAARFVAVAALQHFSGIPGLIGRTGLIEFDLLTLQRSAGRITRLPRCTVCGRGANLNSAAQILRYHPSIKKPLVGVSASSA